MRKHTQETSSGQGLNLFMFSKPWNIKASIQGKVVEMESEKDTIRKILKEKN